MSGEGVSNPGGGFASGPEVRDAIVALPDDDRAIVITSPGSGEYKVYTLNKTVNGELGIKQKATPEV